MSKAINSAASMGGDQLSSWPVSPSISEDKRPASVGSQTPKASLELHGGQEDVPEKILSSSDISQRAETKQSTIMNPIRRNGPLDSDIDTISVQSVDPASSINSYAPLSVMEEAELLPHRRGARYSASPHLQKTKGRKAFVAFCDAFNFLVPIDINDDATSMREASVTKLARSIHHGVAGRSKDREASLGGNTPAVAR